MTVPALTLPRVCRYPESAVSSGPEFIELAESVGVCLDTWQRFILDKGLGERADGKWATFQNTIVVSRQNGKDEVFLVLALGWLFLTGERLIGHSAHEYKTAMEAFRRLIGVIENSDDLRGQVKKIINTNGEEGVELVTGQRIRFLARSKGAGRGFSFDKMIWNEAYALTAPQVDAVLPTMSARPNPQLWLGSSPPLDVATGEAMFNARKAAGSPDVMYLDWQGAEGDLTNIKGCARDGCTHERTELGCVLDDPAVIAAANPAYPHRITPEAVRRERAAQGWQGFARERIGIWPPDLSSGFAVITKAQWEALVATEPELTGRPVFSWDTSPRSAGPVRSSVSVAQRRADGAAHIEVVLTGPGTAWIPQAMAQLKAAHPGAIFVVDPGSPAGSALADVQAAGVTPETMGSRDVASAFGMTYAAANDGEGVRHLGQAELTLAIQGAGTRKVGDGGSAWDRARAGTDITTIVSATHAYWGLATYGGEAPSTEPMVMWA